MPDNHHSELLVKEKSGAVCEFLWGAGEIGAAIGRNGRQTHHLIAHCEIQCARKVRGQWVANRSGLLREFGGRVVADSDPGGVSASADNKALRERAARLGCRLRKRRGSYWLLDNDDECGMGFETLADAADEIGRRERGEQRSANHTIPKARRITPQAEHGAVLPEDWHEMSLGALWGHLNRPRKTPQTTIEAVIYSVRERGVAALREPANITRLLECDDDTRIEINERIARLNAVESLTRWRTPLSDKQRVWPHDIVAKSKPTRGSFRAGRTRCAWILVIKKCPERGLQGG